MICLHCGSCCVQMFVVVPRLGAEGLRAIAKPSDVRCPNLQMVKGQYLCAVHALPEYEGSPCWVYGNPDVDPDYAHTRGRPCRVGLAWQQRGGTYPVPEHTTEVLGDLGPWPTE